VRFPDLVPTRTTRKRPSVCAVLTVCRCYLLDSSAKNGYARLAADVRQEVSRQRIEERWSVKERPKLFGNVGAESGRVLDVLNDRLAAAGHR
jgi:hypothetical protein